MTESNQKQKIKIKICMVGRYYEEKVHIIHFFTKGSIPVGYQKLTSVSMEDKTIEIDQYIIRLQIFYFPYYSPRFISMLGRSFFSLAHIVLLVMSTVKPIDFKYLQDRYNAILQTNENLEIILVNNLMNTKKHPFLDLTPIDNLNQDYFDKLNADGKQIMNFLQKKELLGYIECSPEQNVHIDRLFEVAYQRCIENNQFENIEEN